MTPRDIPREMALIVRDILWHVACARGRGWSGWAEL